MFAHLNMDDALAAIQIAIEGADGDASTVDRLVSLAQVADALASVLNQVSPAHDNGLETKAIAAAYAALSQLHGWATNEADRLRRAG